MNTNLCIFTGRLGADPKMEYTAGGTARASFRLAINIGHGDKQRTTWAQIIAWEKTAEVVGQHLGKGDLVLVRGEYRLNEWEGKDGQKHSRPEFWARQVEFLALRRSGGVFQNAPDARGQIEGGGAGGNAPNAPSDTPAPYPDDDLPF